MDLDFINTTISVNVNIVERFTENNCCCEQENGNTILYLAHRVGSPKNTKKKGDNKKKEFQFKWNIKCNGVMP